MRYARYRSTVLGHEPRPRNRTNPDQNRVTKAKKQEEETSKKKVAKKEKAEEPKIQSSQTFTPSPSLKDDNEFFHPGPSSLDNIYYPTPVSMATPMSDNNSRTCRAMRHITPFSDTDNMTPPPHIFNPTAAPTLPTDMLPGQTDTTFGHTNSATAITASWQPVLPACPGYGMEYEVDSYGNAYVVSNSQQNEQHAAEQFRLHADMIEHENQTGLIKQEEWDAEYQLDGGGSAGQLSTERQIRDGYF